MEQNEKIQQVISKLRKLQKLYEGAKKINSEEEANAAAAAIQRLLTEYNLTMEAVGEEPIEKAIQEEIISGYEKKTHGGDWVHKLTSVICKYNFCKCYYFGRGNKRLLIVGAKENLETVKWLRGMLMERFYELGKRRYKEYCDEYEMYGVVMGSYKLQRRNPWLRRYLLGCASGLNFKLKAEENKMKAESEQMGSKVTALVVRNDAAIVEYMYKNHKMGKPRVVAGLGWSSASEIGFKDGVHTNINKPLSSGTTQHNVKMLNA